MKWLDRAACRHHDPELFFPIGDAGPGQAQIEEAKRVCRTCPVLGECRDWAITNLVPFGVLGGLSENERAALACSLRARHRTAARAAHPDAGHDGRFVAVTEASTTRISPRELTVGDVLRFNDRTLHVVAVERDVAVAVRTAEFDFLLHFAPDESVDVVSDAREPSTAA